MLRRSALSALLTATSTLCMATASSAQTAARTDPPKAGSIIATPVYSWTGAYVGLNAGLSGGTYRTQSIEVEAITAGEPQEQTLNRLNNQASGALIGVQGGYLYQFQNNLVLGAEVDFAFSSYRFSTTVHEISNAHDAVPESELSKRRLPYFGTLRARAGYAIGPVLPYVTGGLAFGRTETLFGEGEAEAGMPPVVKSGRTNWGYAIGAGLEYAIAPSWRVKAEYLYTSLAGYNAPGLENTTAKVASQFSTVRVGLNYAFGGANGAGPAGAVFQTAGLSNGKPRFDGFSVGVTAGLAAGSTKAKAIESAEEETTVTKESFNTSGAVIGFEVGYHYAFANDIVIGAVADYQFTNFAALNTESEQNAEEAAKEKFRIGVSQFGTVRARAGYVIGAFMPYVTGGLAYGQLQYRNFEMPVEEANAVTRANQTKTGYALGAGLEYALTTQLSFKVEYLYVDLGSLRSVNGEGIVTNAPVALNLARAGLTYRF